MKTVIILVLSALAVAKCGDLIAGHKKDGKKIFDEKIEATPTLWKQQHNVTVNATEGNIISRVVVTDLRETKDADVDIVEGKIGDKSVTLQFKSPAAFRGYEFHVEVFSSPDDNLSSGNNFPAHPMLVGGMPINQQFDQPRTNFDNFSPKSEENTPSTKISGISTTEQQNREERHAENDLSSSTMSSDTKKEIRPALLIKTSEDQDDYTNGKSSSSSTTEQQKREERDTHDNKKDSSTSKPKTNDQNEHEIKETSWMKRSTGEVQEGSHNAEEKSSTTTKPNDNVVPSTTENQHGNEKSSGNHDVTSIPTFSDDIIPISSMHWTKRDTLEHQEDKFKPEEKTPTTIKATILGSSTEQNINKRNAHDYDGVLTTQKVNANDHSGNLTPKLLGQNDPSKTTNNDESSTENQNRTERQANDNDKKSSTTQKTTLTTDEVNQSFWSKRVRRSDEKNIPQVNFKTNENKNNFVDKNKTTEPSKVDSTTEKINNPLGVVSEVNPEQDEKMYTEKNVENKPTPPLNNPRSIRQTSENYSKGDTNTDAKKLGYTTEKVVNPKEFGSELKPQNNNKIDTNKNIDNNTPTINNHRTFRQVSENDSKVKPNTESSQLNYTNEKVNIGDEYKPPTSINNDRTFRQVTSGNDDGENTYVRVTLGNDPSLTMDVDREAQQNATGINTPRDIVRETGQQRY